ncbi:general stress protein [Priestia endophytica]|uniref:general stress protein n=1 Tax=Priestia endophytica TaxID=135735 RepID=UPI0022831952|nr:general stress protein [Priestia endophytica]MCY8231390.1 general stress protein [Priestia endophytica]
MKPVVREYTNDELLKEDVKKLQVQGIYVLSHDDERTNRVANNADANTIGIKEMGLGTAASNLFNKKGDELRHKLSEVGLSKTEAEMYEEKLDQGKVLVIITNNETVRL